MAGDYYKGMVARQDLVDHCREQVRLITEHVKTLEKARDLTKDPYKIQAFNEAVTLHFGEQLGFRNVCEWAKDHYAEEDTEHWPGCFGGKDE